MSGHGEMELLAPVGEMEALRAAVQNGADAVYMGGKLFNARQNARNFTLEELKEVVRYCHLYGVRVYITVNTLLENREFPELLTYLYSLYTIGVDAVIVQDLGIAHAVGTLLPDLELHASTQTTIMNSSGARFLEDMGYSRVVLAREVSLENTELIRQRSRIHLEVFIHGALCVCYSGQCLMSSMIGGRSGNRGRCAQPCRLPYSLVDSKGAVLAEGHLLSPRDLNLIEHLPSFIEAGISAIKVEGRMKRPEYVATVIRHYHQVLRQYYEGKTPFRIAPDCHKELAQIFNRDFTTGYYLEKSRPELMSYQRPNNRGLKLGRVTGFNPKTREVTVNLEEPLRVGDGYEIWVTKGGRIAGEIKELSQMGHKVAQAESGAVAFHIAEGMPRVGDRVFKTMDLHLMEEARKTFQTTVPVRREPLKAELRIRIGQPLRLKASDNKGHMVEVQSGFIVEEALKHPASEETLRHQLDRLGNTIFYLEQFNLELDEKALVPASELNNLRREAVERIEELRLAEYPLHSLSKEEYDQRVHTLEASLPQPARVTDKPGISVTVGDMASLQAAAEAGCDVIYFGGERLRRKKSLGADDISRAVLECHNKGAQAVLMLPRLFHEAETDRLKELFERGQQAGVDAFLAGNPGTLQLARELGAGPIWADYTFNIFNDYTVKVLIDRGVKQVTLSPELTLEQIGGLRHRGLTAMECLVHGALPLMITEHCTVGNILGRGHRERGCPMPCLKDNYGLKDRMNMVFPLESDEDCRMLVFNPKTLNMLERLPAFFNTGVRLFRIEARKEEPYWVRKVVQIYKNEVQRSREMGADYTALEAHKEALAKLSPGGFTTGHYYRGVE